MVQIVRSKRYIAYEQPDGCEIHVICPYCKQEIWWSDLPLSFSDVGNLLEKLEQLTDEEILNLIKSMLPKHRCWVKTRCRT